MLYLPGPESRLPVSRKALGYLYDSLVPPDSGRGGIVELEIVTADTDLNARELASFLRAVDEAYGRLMYRDLSAYARRRESQLQIAEVRHGSLVLSFQEFVSAVESAQALILVYYFLHYLRPTSLRNLGEAYERYQTGRLRRAEAFYKEDEVRQKREEREEKERRKVIRELAKADERLGKLPARQRNEIVRLLDELYEREHRLLPRASRFLRDVRDIRLRFRRDS